MRRIAPGWFTDKEFMGKFHNRWPWVLSGAMAMMYASNPEPFDEATNSMATKLKRPLLRGTEWIEYHDSDPESAALEFPVDRIFGPLELSQQMDFLLHALHADNELADGYLTRIVIDHTDVSLDPPPLGDALTKHRGKDLMEFAIADFTGARYPRKNAFFNGDQFLRVINIYATQNELAEWFVKEKDGISLLFRALAQSKEDYARVLTMRMLTVFALAQEEDGSIERRILQGDFVPNLMDCYRTCTGDPTDTRYVTMLLSSLLRHYPEQALRDLNKCSVMQTAIEGLNISRYKGLPQHYRIINDLLNVPAQVQKKVGIDTKKQMLQHDLIGVGSGVLNSFPEYMEASIILFKLFRTVKKDKDSIAQFLECDTLRSCNKVMDYHLNKNKLGGNFFKEGSLGDDVIEFIHDLAKYRVVKDVFEGGPENIQKDWKNFQEYEKQVRMRQQETVDKEKEKAEIAAAARAADQRRLANSGQAAAA